MGLRITTWNVNGIRNPFSYQPWRDKRTFVAMFDILEADIIVLQETKIQRKDLRDDMVLVPGWDCYFSLPKHEKGKFGVVIYTRQSVCSPIRAEEGITGVLCPPNSATSFRDLTETQQIGGYPTISQASNAPNAPDMATEFLTLDSEGRCVILEFPAFVLVGVYNPATRDESRTAFRISFLNLLDIRVRNLVSIGKRVILTGDLNIVKTASDMANCESDLRKAGTTEEDYFSRPAQRMLNHLVTDGIVWGDKDKSREEAVMNDLCRSFHPTREGMFTCWETKINARPGNYGSRIDYVLCSNNMKDWFCEANIQEGLMGSDHCPVYAVIKEQVSCDGQTTSIRDIMNPIGMFREGKRLREYSAKDMQPLSGRLIPEFNGRRSIKDMFSRKLSQGGKGTSSILSDQSNLKDPESKGSQTSPDRGSPLIKRTIQGNVSSSSGNFKQSNSDSGGDISFTKRPLASTSPLKSQKRLKSQQSSFETNGSGKGQQNLTSFFQSKRQSDRSNGDDLATGTRSTKPASNDFTDKELAQSLEMAENGFTEEALLSIPQVDGTIASPEYVHDPIEAKESWSKLFSKPAAPLCESHAEPCKVMTTKKPGPNCGRSFWMCAKPLGPSGQKEKGTQWRCGTFIWCSDFKGI